jgi:hypothetical protein
MKVILSFIFLLLFYKEAFATNIKIILHHENKSFFNGVNVCFWVKNAFIYDDKPTVCVKSDERGIIEADIKEGEYFLFASKKLTNKYLFGFYGLNPLKLTKNQVLNINLIEYPEKFIKKTKDRVVKGKVFYKGIPLKDAEVLFYTDLTTELKGPPFFYAKTDENGVFSVYLEEGSYYLFVKKKKEPFGPPKSGDFVSFFPHFPIVVKGKEGYELHVEVMKISDKISESFNKLVKIYGCVKDKNDKSMKNIYVVAYDRSELLGKPKYISSPSDEDGRFVMYIKEPGNYFIVVRKSLGDTPDMSDVFVHGEIKVGEENEKKIDIITDFDS